jgi:hypothetical protein
MSERPANLLFWFKDGMCGRFDARVEARVKVSIGRTDSKRALGFIISTPETVLADFVFDRDQLAELGAFIEMSRARLRKPLRRKPKQISLAKLLNRPLRCGRACKKRR